MNLEGDSAWQVVTRLDAVVQCADSAVAPGGTEWQAQAWLKTLRWYQGSAVPIPLRGTVLFRSLHLSQLFLPPLLLLLTAFGATSNQAGFGQGGSPQGRHTAASRDS